MYLDYLPTKDYDTDIEAELDKRREYFEECLRLVKSSYEYNPKMFDLLVNCNRDIDKVCEVLPGQKELNNLYRDSLEWTYKTPIYGYFGRVFPSVLMRNIHGMLDKVHMGDMTTEEKANVHISLTRGEWNFKTELPKDLDLEDFDKICTKEEITTIDNKKYKVTYKVKEFKLNYKVNAAYDTILFDTNTIEENRKKSQIEDYSYFKPDTDPIINFDKIPDEDWFITANRIGNDDYTSHTFTFPVAMTNRNIECEKDQILHFLKHESVFTTLLYYSLSYIQEGNELCILDNINNIYLQILANLYFPKPYSLSKYDSTREEANNNLLRLVYSFMSRGRNFSHTELSSGDKYCLNILSVSKEFNLDCSSSVVSNPDGFDPIKEGKPYTNGSVVEYHSEPTIVAEHENDNDKFVISITATAVCDILNIEEVNSKS